jgi:hypothetical protein
MVLNKLKAFNGYSKFKVKKNIYIKYKKKKYFLK